MAGGSEGMPLPTDELGTLYRSVNIALLVLALISVLMRCFVRIGMLKSFGVDDYWMLVATASFISCSTVDFLSVKNGFGKHMWTLGNDEIRESLKFSYASEITYSITMICTKISIACFLLRIARHPVQRYTLYIATTLACIVGLVLVFIVIFQCKPVALAWDKSLPGTCLAPHVISTALYTYSALAVATDLTFTLLPIFIIWKLQMEKRAKIALVPIMSLAFLASIAVIVRIPLIKEFGNPDFLYAITPFSIWSVVEQSLAITASSLPTLRPLLTKAFELVKSSAAGSKYKWSTGRTGYGINSNGPGLSVGNDHGSWNVPYDGTNSNAIMLRSNNFTRLNDETDDNPRYH